VPESNLNLIKPDARGNIVARDNGSMRAARDWLLDGTTWSLTIIGRPQCGKSTGAAWLAHQLLMRRFRPTWIDCTKQSQEPMYGARAEYVRYCCRSAASLVLDDLGGGRRERESEFWGAWLDDVVGSRANERRKTIITTNRSEAELSAWLGPRLLARLQAGIICTTADPSMRGRS
jgi:DNA replication protein DnaC